MNSHKINYQEQIQQGHGLVNDFSFDFPDWDQIQQHPCAGSDNNNIRSQNQQHPCAGSDNNNIRSQNQQNLRPPTIMEGFKSPASAFYATELFMGFDSQFANTSTPMTSQVSRTCDSQIFSSGGTASSIGSAAQSDPIFDVRNTLQSIVKSHFCGNQFSNMNPRSSYDVSAPRQFLNPHVEDQDQRVHGSSFNSQQGLSSEQEKLSSGEGSASTAAVVSSKIRIRWTQELHEKFVECINRLGGAEKATPKAILKLMDSDGLTIFHVKSHLQKYRIAKYMPEKAEGKSDKRATLNDFPQLDSKTGLQIKEALQLQLDVQKRLHEQLEIQRNLQLRIEEQGKQLRVMFDQQQKANGPLKNNDISSSPEDAEAEEDGSNNTIFPSKIS